MKIISGQIDNFGKLSNYKFEFEEGLNIINEENGWGKTTFAAFLKAMFFGMEYSRSKKILTDRARYSPWNGGKFGGSLQFLIHNKEYRIVRSFGKKESDDTFVLYEVETSMLSEDFTENIGEEIWKVDRDSFEKTAFVTLKEFDLLNDIISGKLGNIDEQEADMEASTMAIDSLDRSINRLSSKRSTNAGSIKNMKEQQADLKLELDKSLLAQEEQEEKEISLKKALKDRNAITLSIEAIEEEYMQMQVLNQKQNLLELQQSLSDALNNYELIKNKFPNQIPSVVQLKEVEKYVEDYYKSYDQMMRQQPKPEVVTEYEALMHQFSINTPTLEDLEYYGDILTQISVIESKMQHVGISPAEASRLEALDAIYHPIMDKEVNVDQLINDYIGVSELDKRANLYSVEMDKIADDVKVDERSKKQKADIFKIILSIIFTFLGVFLFFNLSSVIMGFFLTIAGIISTVLHIFRYSGRGGHPSAYEQFGETTKEELQLKLDATLRTRDELKANYTEVLALLEFYTHDIMNTLLNAKSEIQEYKRLIVAKQLSNQNNKELIEELEQKQNVVDTFLATFLDISQIDDRRSSIENLQVLVTRFHDLEKQFTQYHDLCTLCADWEKVVQTQLAEYFYQIPTNYKDALETMKTSIIMLQERGNELERMKEKYEKFIVENDMELLNSLDPNTTMSVQYLEQLSTKKTALLLEKEELTASILGLRKEIEVLSTEGDKVMDLEVAIDSIMEDIKALEEEANIKKLTRECMVLAKENLAKKYMGSITESFDKYRKVIEDDELSNYHIDISLNVKVEQDGMLYPVENLSKGKYDLLQICMRLALVEAVFKEVDKPTLILDDPLVNLDDDRLQNAVKLFNKLGNKHQLIYFVCHTSRVI